jgi:dipeptidyl aminopeptidase/acylaminoacyl peptidase
MTKKTNQYQATLRDMLALEAPTTVRVSPNGTKVAFLVRSTNWKDDRYENYCQIYDDATGVTRTLTRYGNVSQMEWVDDETLALLKTNGDKAQVWFYEGGVGEGWQVTDHKTGVEWFHPFAGGIVFRASQPDKDEKKARTDQYGTFTHFEQEESASAVYFVGIQELLEYQKQLRAATEDEGKKLVAPVIELSKLFTKPVAIKEIVVSPTGDTLYLNCWRRDDLVYMRETRVFQVKLNAKAALAKYMELEKAKQAETKTKGRKSKKAAKARKEDVSYLGKLSELKLPKGARVAAVSPDGTELLISYKERDQMFYTREDLWVASTKAVEQVRSAAACLRAMSNITAHFDREMMSVHWTQAGIFADYVDSTNLCIARLGRKGKVTPLDLGMYEFGDFHVSNSGHLAISGANAVSFAEVYLAGPVKKNKKWETGKLTDFGKQVKNWDLGTVETITWQSKDGTEIEGILRKPSNFDPAKKYPLVFVVHGGPTWFSQEYLLAGEDMRYYPALQFNLKNVLVLKPNYRGSTGRGQAFQELNVNNLGIGDLCDVESAVDHLVELGWVDPEKVGCMGWSQGGYISAFVGLHSKKFKAVSVGAGISDWYTYHISNDIPDFTRDYLSGSPFRDRSLYHQTAPISNLSNAKTPMLIQHGSDDQRVPLSNATELYRGLKEMGVPVELFIFPGMAHPITKPRENYAVMYQNLNWFSHYLLGEALKLE